MRDQTYTGTRRWQTPDGQWSVTLEVLACTGKPGQDGPRLIVRQRQFVQATCRTTAGVEAVLGAAYSLLEEVAQP